MIILVDDYSVSISRDNMCFRLESPEGVRNLSPVRVSAIHILKPCTISTPALALAAAHGIPVLIFNSAAQVVATVGGAGFGSTVRIRHAQADHSRSNEAHLTAAEWLNLGFMGRASLLRQLARRIASNRDHLIANADRLDVAGQSIVLCETPSEIFAAEALVTKAYWACLSESLDRYLSFEGRSRRPAQDEFNAALNYGYGMLYSMIETAAITAGLDPYIGLLHREDYNRPAFVFDAIEPFRSWIEAVVVNFAVKREFKSVHFDRDSRGVQLSKEGKKWLIPAILEFMAGASPFRGRRIKRRDQIQAFMHDYTRWLQARYPGRKIM